MNRRPRLTHGPRTWALAREDYLAGDMAKVVCHRYGIRLAAFRRRAWLEGWTKQKHAVAVENARLGPAPTEAVSAAETATLAGDRAGAVPASSAALSPPLALEPAAPQADPRRAVQTATRRAAEALKAGRALEAQALVKAAEGLVRLAGQVGPLPPPEEPEAVELRLLLGLPEDPDAYAVFMNEVWDVAGTLARELLAAEPEAPAMMAREVYGWRARHLSAEVAARDKARARAEGWWDKVFDREGRPLPPLSDEARRRAVEAMVAEGPLRDRPVHLPPALRALAERQAAAKAARPRFCTHKACE